MIKNSDQYVKQNDGRCMIQIRDIGCFFRSALNIVERKFNVAFEPRDLNILWHSAKVKKIIDDDDCLLDSAKLMNLAISMYLPERSGAFAEIGLKRFGSFTPYKWAERYSPEFFIRKIKQGGPSGVHFVVVDNNDKRIWEPHDPEIKDLGEVYTICYRYFG